MPKQQLNILIINWQDIKNPFGGGAEVHLHQIFKRIVGFGHNVDLLCCKVDELEEHEVIDGINVYRWGNRNTFNFNMLKAYKSIFSHKSYDIVIDDVNKIPFYTPLYVTKPLLGIAHHFFGSSIFRETGFIGALYVYLAEKLIKQIYPKTPFTAVSKSTKDEMISWGFNSENIEIIHNAITPEDYPMELTKKSDYPIITYFGRLKKYKSPDHLFKAFAKISTDFPKAELHVAGKGDFESDLKKLAQKLKISNKTVFHAYISEEEKIEILSKSHTVVNTSMKEGWGITNIEASSCGTPVVSANVPGLRDSVSEGKSGLLYKYGDIEDLTSKLRSILTDKDLFVKLQNGSVSWAKEFSWDLSAKKMEELIFKTINNFKR